MLYRLYGFIHRTTKKILKKANTISKQYKMVNFDVDSFMGNDLIIPSSYEGTINEIDVSKRKRIKKEEVYPIENLVKKGCTKFVQTFPGTNIFAEDLSSLSTELLWKRFIKQSKIPMGYKHGGCCYAGYIKELRQWCLPSWIWTSAAVVRYYCSFNQINEAIHLGDIILSYQQKCGGWIVRNDYVADDIVPQLAPNDSAYIANNCCIELYLKTGERRFWDAAVHTAAWIMETARPDGLVFIGYDTKENTWIKDKNIVDVGFTAALFARLYQESFESKYKIFLERFVKKYINIFYMPSKKCFATAVNASDEQTGGAFGRGQAWALEGLIPAYEVLKYEKLKKVICATISTLLNKQKKNGGWHYNLMKPMMGVDCKATPVLAWNLLAWYRITQDLVLIESAKKAINWCEKHTAVCGNAAGGIFSYTIEGAVVHHMYTSTAFVYSSSYALEVKQQLRELAHES